MDWRESMPFLSDEDVQAARAKAQETEENKAPHSDSVVEALAKLGANVVTEVPKPTERITLVAIHTVTSSTLQAETIINQIAWQAINDYPEVVAHWIAMDGRADITDEDSAVFVKKGLQKQVQDHLVATGLASEGATSLGE